MEEKELEKAANSLVSLVHSHSGVILELGGILHQLRKRVEALEEANGILVTRINSISRRCDDLEGYHN